MFPAFIELLLEEPLLPEMRPKVEDPEPDPEPEDFQEFFPVLEFEPELEAEERRPLTLFKREEPPLRESKP